MIHIEPSTILFMMAAASAATALLYCEISKTKKRIGNYISFWSNETSKMQEMGYLAPKPGPRETAIVRGIFVVKGSIENVKIRVIGRENIPVGRTIIVANHVDLGDTDVLSQIVGRRPGRFLIAAAEVPAEKPEGILMAMAGAITVDMNSKIGKVKAMKAAGKALVVDGNEALLAVFPQGQLDREEGIELETFKRGTAEIARIAASEADAPVFIVPIGIHYKHDAAKVPLLHKVLKKVFNKILPETHDGRLFFSETKYQAVAVIGKPLLVNPPASDKTSSAEILSEDKVLATEMIYRSIKSAHADALTI